MMDKLLSPVEKKQKKNRDRTQSFYESLDESENNQEIVAIQGNDQKYDKIYMYYGQKFAIQETFVIRETDAKLYTELYITNYRLIIIRKDPISIPYGYIANISVLPNSLKIQLKTGVNFQIQPQRNLKDVKAYIEHAINQLPFCLNYTSDKEKASIYDSYAEIERMRVDNKQYKIYKNSNHKFCSSYPLHIIIPKEVEINNLSQIKKCRLDGRIPVMSFYDDQVGVGIWRASKVYKQLPREVSKFDQAYLQQISKELCIISLQVGTKYVNLLSFESLQNLKKTYQNYVGEYWKSMHSVIGSRTQVFLKMQGRWYEQIDKLISLSYYIVSKVKDRKHVLVEENLSLDRTPQLISLSSVIIDPFYRTFDGLSILIQKQFISFGHPFQTRCGFLKNHEDSSPVFIQFLQALNQLIVTHPQCFQYTPAYLANIAYEVYTTKYMNFMDRIGNPSKVSKLMTCKASFWDEEVRKKCHHSFHYQPEKGRQLLYMRRKPSVKEYLTWTQYFDCICRMNFEKQLPYDSVNQSRRLSKFLSQKQLE